MRMFSFLAKYSPLVEQHLRECEREIRDPRCILPALVDDGLQGRMTVVVLHEEMIEQPFAVAQRNQRIVDLVKSEGFQMFKGRTGTVMTAKGHSVTCKSVDACFDALFALDEGTITETDLDGREDGTQVVAMGAR